MDMIFIVPPLVLLAELIWQIFIKYPPTLEQLHFGVGNPATLWAVRLLSLGLLLAASFFFSRLASTKIRRYFWILVLLSPAFSLLWMSYPLDTLKIFIIAGAFYLLSRYRKTWIAVAGVCLILLSLNLIVFKQSPKIIETLSLRVPAEEVALRFYAEDNLNPHIEIPTLLRRVAYNKYFVALKDSVNESLTFFDFETLFFQEVHPLGQKAFVIFFWPEIFIFSLSIWLFLTKRRAAEKGILPLLFLSFVYFITTNTSAERRLFLTLYPLAILMAGCLDTFFKSGSKKISEAWPAKPIKIGVTLLLFLTFYGWMTNYYDRYVRPAYWLDNRPIAYDFFLSYLKNHNEKYSRILVPDTLYAAKDYCLYYLKDCTLFKNENFDLSRQSANGDTLYIGFAGNFLGPNPENSFPSDLTGDLNRKGLEILQQTHILNNIANTYGQELLIARTKR